MASKRTTVVQPQFDGRIQSLVYPLHGGRASTSSLKRGLMIWDKPIAGFSNRAQVNFLYNPSTVEADYPLSDSSVGASLLFPNSHDSADLRVPLYQTVEWSILYDRTYELWGSYNADGTPMHSIGKDNNNPQVVGCLADIYQMQQFTGMTVDYSSTGVTASMPMPFIGHQGILQLVPSWVYFGDSRNLKFYGYISEWSFQVTHWTEFMVPMRCVIDITMTMLPPTQNTSTPGITSSGPGGKNNWGQGPSPTTQHHVAGVSGR